MKLISFEEYDALMAYMEPKLLELWRHENGNMEEFHHSLLLSQCFSKEKMRG